MRKPGFVKLISSVDTGKKNVVDSIILPGERTPWIEDATNFNN
jgi:hypothetical protein